MGKGGLVCFRSGTIGSYLGPAFAEQITEVPACLNGRTKQLFICRLAVPIVLPQGEEHLGQGPAGSEERVCLPRKGRSLLHKAMTQREIEVQSSFAKDFRKIAVVCIVKVVVELETDSQN